jgi:hypothetical protein
MVDKTNLRPKVGELVVIHPMKAKCIAVRVLARTPSILMLDRRSRKADEAVGVNDFMFSLSLFHSFCEP